MGWETRQEHFPDSPDPFPLPQMKQFPRRLKHYLLLLPRHQLGCILYIKPLLETVLPTFLLLIKLLAIKITQVVGFHYSIHFQISRRLAHL